jgi:hypothetical protein
MSKKTVARGIELGFYPGILVGIRTYQHADHRNVVLYIPFVDINFWSIYEDDE